MKQGFDRIIIIAFDGLDYEKIQKYDCHDVMQEEFGQISLDDMPLTTGPLWSSFITGLYPEEHGVQKTRDIDAEHLKRKEETFEALEDEDFAFLMSHFHKSDFMQHLYGFNEEKERGLYEEFDKLAEKILEYTNEDDLVIFCSDHGLEDGGHRRQAFYSANHDLGLDNPHITEFRDILNSVEVSKNISLDLDV